MTITGAQNRSLSVVSRSPFVVDERGHRDERESWLSLVEKEGLRSHNSVMQSRFGIAIRGFNERNNR